MHSPSTPPHPGTLPDVHRRCARRGWSKKSGHKRYTRKRLEKQPWKKRRPAHGPARVKCPRHCKGQNGLCIRTGPNCPLDFVSRCRDGSKRARSLAMQRGTQSAPPMPPDPCQHTALITD